MFTQPKNPNNKNKPAYKKYCSYCHRTNHSISACFKKQRDDENKRDAYMFDQNLHKNHSYNTSVLLLMTEQKIMIIAIEAEVPHATTLTTKLVHKIDTVLHLEIDLVTTKVLLLHNTLDHDMILINAIHAPHTDLRIDPLIDTVLALDTDHDLIQGTQIFTNIQILTDHLLDQEILDLLDPVHTPILKTRSIQYKRKTNLTL